MFLKFFKHSTKWKLSGHWGNILQNKQTTARQWWRPLSLTHFALHLIPMRPLSLDERKQSFTSKGKLIQYQDRESGKVQPQVCLCECVCLLEEAKQCTCGWGCVKMNGHLPPFTWQTHCRALLSTAIRGSTHIPCCLLVFPFFPLVRRQVVIIMSQMVGATFWHNTPGQLRELVKFPHSLLCTSPAKVDFISHVYMTINIYKLLEKQAGRQWGLEASTPWWQGGAHFSFLFCGAKKMDGKLQVTRLQSGVFNRMSVSQIKRNNNFRRISGKPYM